MELMNDEFLLNFYDHEQRQVVIVDSVAQWDRQHLVTVILDQDISLLVESEEQVKHRYVQALEYGNQSSLET